MCRLSSVFCLLSSVSVSRAVNSGFRASIRVPQTGSAAITHRVTLTGRWSCTAVDPVDPVHVDPTSFGRRAETLQAGARQGLSLASGAPVTRPKSGQGRHLPSGQAPTCCKRPGRQDGTDDITRRVMHAAVVRMRQSRLRRGKAETGQLPTFLS